MAKVKDDRRILRAVHVAVEVPGTAAGRPVKTTLRTFATEEDLDDLAAVLTPAQRDYLLAKGAISGYWEVKGEKAEKAAAPPPDKPVVVQPAPPPVVRLPEKAPPAKGKGAK